MKMGNGRRCASVCTVSTPPNELQMASLLWGVGEHGLKYVNLL